MSAHSSAAETRGLAHHFEDFEQQLDASTFGMWLFLITEVLFFGGLFAGYTLYRSHMPHAFELASSHLDIPLGAMNTVVLIFSSLTMALAVRACQMGNNKLTRNLLVATLLLGFVFLGVKVVEYSAKFEHHLVPGYNFDQTMPQWQGQQMFYQFYFALTGMHALHMIIGSGLLLYFIIRSHQGRYHSNYFGPVEVMGLYWHFVDIVWIFLFPLLYLLGLHVGGKH